MREPRLLGIGRAVPGRQVAQQSLLELSPWTPSPLLDKLFLESEIHTRGLMVPPSFFLDAGRSSGRSLTETNAAWLEAALALGGQAIRDALDATGHTPTDIDLFAVTTVTGYATPGLDLLLGRQEGFRNDFSRAHFNCIGCHAALPLLKVARDHVALRPDELALAAAVEVCSACFRDTDDAQNLVATSLFADGAAVAVVGTDGEGPVLVDFGSRFDFEHLDALGFSLDSQGFSIVLDPSIPERIAANIDATIDALLRRNGVTREAVRTWTFHPGGSAILDAVQRVLGLTDRQMRASRRILRAHGNMSSPSVLFAFAEEAREGLPDDGYGVLAAFGPGLGIEVALVRYTGSA